MASVSEESNKPVTGYPSQPIHVVTGYPLTSQPRAPAVFYNAAAPPYHLPHPDQLSYFIRRLLTAVLTVLLIMGAAFFTLWLVLRPRLPEFRVPTASLSPLNATASEISASWNLSILVTNPNKRLAMFYDRLEASVVYGDDFILSETELPPFSQPKMNQTLLRVHLAVAGDNVGNDVVRAILGDRNFGVVRFSVRVIAMASFESGAWRMRNHLLRVYCDGVDIGFSSNNRPGTLLNPTKKCEVAF